MSRPDSDFLAVEASSEAHLECIKTNINGTRRYFDSKQCEDLRMILAESSKHKPKMKPRPKPKKELKKK